MTSHLLLEAIMKFNSFKSAFDQETKKNSCIQNRARRFFTKSRFFNYSKTEIDRYEKRMHSCAFITL